MRASGRAPQRKSRKPATRDVLDRLLTTCSGSIVIDLRDRSILLGAFMAGGRRRSEVATRRHSQITAADPIQLRPADPVSPTLPCIRIALGSTQTITVGQGAFLFAANLILKKRCRMAGPDPTDFSAHGLRSVLMTQVGHDGIPPVDAMR